MSTATENQQASNSSSSIRGVVARHPVVAFLAMAFVIGWGGMLPLLLSESGPFGVVQIELPWKPFTAILSIFGLALPAFLITAATGGKDGVRDLLRRIFRWQVGVHWYLMALFGLLVATLLGAIPFLGVVPLEALAQNWTLLFTVFLPGVLVPFVLVNLWEETGWTGFIQHTLQEGHGPLLASVIVAPFFALIHLPAYFVAGWISDEKMSLNEFPAVLVQVGVIAVFAIFLRTLIMWLYNGSGHSVLIVGLFHSAFNMTNGQKITPELFHLPESLAALIPLAPVAVIAVLLVVFTRGRLAYEPGRSAAPRVAAAGGAAAPQGCNNQPLDRRAPVQAHGDPGLPTQKGEKEMATTATPSRLTTTTRAFPLAAYFVLAYALSWLILVPAGLGLLPDSAGGVLPWLVPFGPAVAAFVVTGLTGGRPAVGQLLRRLVQWRVGVGWYLLVLLSIPLVELMGAFAVLGSAPLDDLARNWPVIFTGYLPAVVYVAIFTGMGEEPGWRGFALPSLQDRHGPLLATAVLAVVWGRWHLPNVLFGGWTGLSFSLWMALTIASTFIYTWVYNHTGGSILMAALLHGAINGGTELVTGLLPGLDDELHLPLYGAVALAFTVAAVVLVVITKGRLGYRAERVPLEAPARS